MPYVVKAAIEDPKAKSFSFLRAKTMYGGKSIKAGDEIFVFASEQDGGAGLVARGRVTQVEAVAPKKNVERQTPRVSIAVEREGGAPKQTFGRDRLKAWRGVDDGSPQAELDFKFYRQATNKIGGISDEAAAFLRRLF